MKTAFFLGVLAALVLSQHAGAQMPSPGGSDAPVEISAARALIWDRTAKTYKADKDARARQGTFEVSADSITARYEGEGGDIREMTAEGGVVIVQPPYTAYGDRAVYDVIGKTAILTGTGLAITTATEKLTARDKIEFISAENRLSAHGNAVATRGTDTLKADTLNAFFASGTDGKMALERITAKNNVIITTARETVHGDAGTYDVRAGKAVLTGKVKIYQGENLLEGTRADVDLNTGLSQLFADDNPATEGRVKGVFYPKKKN